MTSRRGFLSFLGAAVASATLDPERLLWVPGAKIYSIPAVRIATDTETMVAQIEFMRPNMEKLMLLNSVFWKRLNLEPCPFNISFEPL